MNVWRSWAETRVLTMTFSNMKQKNWMNITLDSLPKFAKVSVKFAHAAQLNCDSSLPNSSPPLLWLLGDNKQWCWHWVFFNKAPAKYWEKLALALSSFAVLLHHCSDCKNCDFKISFIELFHVVCLQ